MQPAADEMKELLQNAPIQRPAVPVITNVSAVPVTDPEILRGDLIEQITHSVRWTESMAALGATGIKRVIEVGPGAVLKGLMRRIDREIDVLSAGNAEDIASTVAELKGEN